MDANQAPADQGLLLRNQFNRLNALANAGNKDALQALRAMLDDHPEVWQELGDLAQHLERALIKRLAVGNVALEDSLRRRCAEMKIELVGEDPSALEKTAADRVISCWLEVHSIDIKFDCSANQKLPVLRQIDQLKSSAQRRYDAALRSLQLVQQKMAGGGPGTRASAAKASQLKIYRYQAAS